MPSHSTPRTAQGLHHLHQRGYLHQDVKPGNVLLTAQRFAKLADFGLTVAANANATNANANANAGAGEAGSSTGEEAYTELVAVGTARYWPPELWDAESKFRVWCGVAGGHRICMCVRMPSSIDPPADNVVHTHTHIYIHTSITTRSWFGAL